MMRALRTRTIATALLGVVGLLTTSAALAAPITIGVTNDATRRIDGLYLSLYADRSWGPDQLNAIALTSGAGVTLSNVACDGSAIVVIAEDEAGCFLYRTVPCGGDASWTITNATTRDCGR